MKKMLLLGLVLLALAFVAPADAQVCMGGAPGCPSGGGTAGSGGITAGAAATGCSAFSYVYVDTSGNLACARAPINGATSTAGTAITSQLETITGASATSNWFNLTGAFPGTLSATTNGVLFDFTGDNDTQAQNGLRVTVAGGASLQLLTGINGNLTGTGGGNNGSVAGLFTNNTTSNLTGTTTPSGVVGQGPAANAVGNYSIGGQFFVDGGNNTALKAFGVRGFATANNTVTMAQAAGVVGQADNTATAANGGWFGPDMSANADSYAGATYFPVITGTTSLVSDNVTTTWNIFEGRDNGTVTSTTVATANVTILDGAQMRLGNQVLTSATMTPTIVGEVRTVTHSYAWTNAMVTALGAVLVGDITVATLPAKTRVDNALLVIDTAAAGTTTLTVSCGDAIGGTPFINYIVPSNAQAAANTVYGDLASGAETGTSLFDATAKWLPNYVPSYTATTLVTCHFISTVANLSAVTTSTGRLILTTTLLP